MIIDRKGELAPGFHAVGSAHTPCYFLDGPRPALFDGGMAFLADAYLADLRPLLGARDLEFLFLTHVHFDHCGAAAAFRKAFPGLRVAASARASEILQRPRALELIRSLNDDATSLASTLGIFEPSPTPFRPFAVDRILADGEEVDLGPGLSVRALATPGHTRDFLSYYVPGRKILVASEAVGCADAAGRITPEFVADYDAYVASIRKLARLDVEVLCQGHALVHSGEDARGYFDRALRQAEEYRQTVEALLEEESGDVDRVVERVKALQYDPKPEPKQPEAAYRINTAARVRLLRERRAG